MQNIAEPYKPSLPFHPKVNKTKDKLLAITAWFAFLMSFNNLLLGGINVSMFLFLYFAIIAVSRYKVLYLQSLPHWAALFFALGAVASVADVNANGEGALTRSLAVLPNYIYWSFMIVLLTNVAPIIGLLKTTNLILTARYIMIGVFLSVVFYEMREFLNFPFLKRNTPNSYAFVLVCYSAIAMIYLRYRYSRNIMLVGLSVILLSMLLLERRAGFMLVALSTFLALNFDRIKLKAFLSILFLSLAVYLLLQLNFIGNQIKNLSPRIHEVIYESGNISTQDQSYLTRVAMIEKGLEIFNEHKLNGIGLNNFANHYVNIPGLFAGAELVIHKELNDKSGHNSYITLLAEGGLFIFLPFLTLILYNLYHFVANLKKRTKLETAFYWSFIAMCVHIFFISEILNVFAWFLLAMVTTISLKYATPKLLLKRKFV